MINAHTHLIKATVCFPAVRNTIGNCLDEGTHHTMIKRKISVRIIKSSKYQVADELYYTHSTWYILRK